MIVVEGPDGAGKTTLINQLVELTGLPVAPRVVSKEAKAMVDLVQWVADNLDAGWQPTIFDRHRLISEPIYGPIFREQPMEGFSNPLWFLDRLRSFYELEPLIIYCLPPLSTIYANIMTDPDNAIYHEDPSLVHKVWGAYYNKITTEKALGLFSFVYDYTQDHMGTGFLNYIAEEIMIRKDIHHV
jgi:hypothetical protein